MSALQRCCIPHQAPSDRSDRQPADADPPIPLRELLRMGGQFARGACCRWVSIRPDAHEIL